MACLLTIGIVQGHFRFWDYWVAAYGFSLLALAFSYILILAVTATESSWTGRLFTKKVLRSFGRYSYVIYLLHVPIGLLLEKAVFSPQNYPLYGSILPATIAFLLLATSVSWITGFLSWNLFEKHFLKLKRFFSYEPTSLASKNG
jgi:peptidoglycan/LPS O-acetylase OafA/YrhL